jgi:MFS family permease
VLGGAQFWMVSVIIMFFYNVIFPWEAVVTEYIQSQYTGSISDGAGYRAGMVYMVSMFVSPFMGGVVDYVGRRDNLAILGSAITIPVFVLFQNKSVDPIIPQLLLGCAYSVCAAALWPTVQMVVPKDLVGRANGVATCMQMFGIGICNLVVGSLQVPKHY